MTAGVCSECQSLPASPYIKTTPRSWLWRQKLACLDAEDFRDVEESFVKQSAPPVFDLDEDVARHAGFER